MKKGQVIFKNNLTYKAPPNHEKILTTLTLNNT